MVRILRGENARVEALVLQAGLVLLVLANVLGRAALEGGHPLAAGAVHNLIHRHIAVGQAVFVLQQPHGEQLVAAKARANHHQKGNHGHGHQHKAHYKPDEHHHHHGHDNPQEDQRVGGFKFLFDHPFHKYVAHCLRFHPFTAAGARPPASHFLWKSTPWDVSYHKIRRDSIKLL